MHPSLGDLTSKEINTFDQRANIKLLQRALAAGERLQVVAQARCPSDRRFRSGLLGATDCRLLFVRERLFRDPLIVSVPFSTVREVLHTGPGALQLKADEAHEFDLIRPPSRSWALWWVIRAAARLGGHS